jgi:hypothetical protein
MKELEFAKLCRIRIDKEDVVHDLLLKSRSLHNEVYKLFLLTYSKITLLYDVFYASLLDGLYTKKLVEDLRTQLFQIIKYEVENSDIPEQIRTEYLKILAIVIEDLLQRSVLDYDDKMKSLDNLTDEVCNFLNLRLMELKNMETESGKITKISWYVVQENLQNDLIFKEIEALDKSIEKTLNFTKLRRYGIDIQKLIEKVNNIAATNQINIIGLRI